MENFQPGGSVHSNQALKEKIKVGAQWKLISQPLTARLPCCMDPTVAHSNLDCL